MTTLENVTKAYEKAIDVFGNYQNAAIWMNCEIPSLRFIKPISLLETDEGLESVINTLLKIEHGIY